MLHRLEWTVLRRLDGLLQGDYRTLWRGAGLDLADLREYQHADDVRHIDWNVTARLQVPHVRQFTEDRELSAWFLLDLSGSIDFGSGDQTKLGLSEGFVAALARLLTRHGNRVGAVLYHPGAADPRQRLAVLPPGLGRLQVLQLLARMRQPPLQAARGQRQARGRPLAGQAAAADAAPTRLADLLARAEGMLRRRSLVFVVSDFISEPGWSAPLGRLARRHEVLAVRLVDALEMALPDIGLLTVEDAETGEQLLVDTQDAGFRQRFEALAAAHEQQLRDQLIDAGVDVLELATHDDLLAALLRYVALRRQRALAVSGHRLPAELRTPRASATAPA
ncbi:MAG: ATPase [Burkholderiales bacterium RIFCSPHIGHO2_12_FULL_69_20]|nr:MAG: ATPase [Burkholderiales bacterium RIFCSPHIGHO2_12_FULL_69_20]